MSRSFALLMLFACGWLCGCTRESEGARRGASWAQGFAESRNWSEPAPLVGLFYAGDPKDRTAQADYYRARGVVDGWYGQEDVSREKLTQRFGQGFDDGMRLGRAMNMSSSRPLPKEANGWTNAERTAYETGFRHGESAQRMQEDQAAGRHLPERPEEFPPALVAAAKTIRGTFRSERVTREKVRPCYYQLESPGDGTAVLSVVDAAGRSVAPATKGWLTLNGNGLAFHPDPAGGFARYRMLLWLYEDIGRLRAIGGSGLNVSFRKI